MRRGIVVQQHSGLLPATDDDSTSASWRCQPRALFFALKGSTHGCPSAAGCSPAHQSVSGSTNDPVGDRGIESTSWLHHDAASTVTSFKANAAASGALWNHRPGTAELVSRHDTLSAGTGWKRCLTTSALKGTKTPEPASLSGSLETLLHALPTPGAVRG